MYKEAQSTYPGETKKLENIQSNTKCYLLKNKQTKTPLYWVSGLNCQMQSEWSIKESESHD